MFWRDGGSRSLHQFSFEVNCMQRSRKNHKAPMMEPNTATPPLVEIKPTVSMIDQKVAITVTGLTPGQNVTLRALLVSDNGNTFQSRAFYIADKLGCVLVKSEPSVGGDYTGIEPMGLMWAMSPATGLKPGTTGSRLHTNHARLLKQDVTKPYCISVELLEGHVGEEANGRVLSANRFEKWYMSAGVRRIPVKEGNIRGTLFLPPGTGPFPGLSAQLCYCTQMHHFITVLQNLCLFWNTKASK